MKPPSTSNSSLLCQYKRVVSEGARGTAERKSTATLAGVVPFGHRRHFTRYMNCHFRHLTLSRRRDDFGTRGLVLSLIHIRLLLPKAYLSTSKIQLRYASAPSA